MSALRWLEPGWWALALAGGLVAALIVPGLLLCFGFGLPLGWFGTASGSFDWLRAALSGSIFVRVGVAAAHALVFWHATHQLRSLVRALGLPQEAAVSWLLLLAAFAGCAWSVRVLVSL